MSYIGGEVEWDVFLTYAHGNDTQRKWSLRMEELLADALNTQLRDRNKDLRVFTDAERLKRNDFIDTQLKPAAQSSAALLVILTQHYVISPSALEELAWFKETVGAAGRIFVVRAQNVKAEEWPEALKLNGKTIFGYEFCDDRPKALPYGMFDQEQELGRSIAKLSEDLSQFLDEQKATVARAAAEAHAADARQPQLPRLTIGTSGARTRVLLGFTVEELEEERAALANELAGSKDLEILAPPFPADANDIHDFADKAAKGGAALIQICGRAPGRWSRNADGFIASQIVTFEAYRRPNWLVMAKDVDVRRLPDSPYAKFLASREKRIGAPPDASSILDAFVAQNTAGRAQSCTIFIQSHKDYERAERQLRQQILAIRLNERMDAFSLPVPPIYAVPDADQVAKVTQQRSQRAGDIQAGLMIFSDKLDLLVVDLLTYRKEREAGIIRWPAAIVATPDAPHVTEDDVGGYPVFRLDDPAFGRSIANWLRDCLAVPGARP